MKIKRNKRQGNHNSKPDHPKYSKGNLNHKWICVAFHGKYLSFMANTSLSRHHIPFSRHISAFLRLIPAFDGHICLPRHTSASYGKFAFHGGRVRLPWQTYSHPWHIFAFHGIPPLPMAHIHLPRYNLPSTTHSPFTGHDRLLRHIPAFYSIYLSFIIHIPILPHIINLSRCISIFNDINSPSIANNCLP